MDVGAKKEITMDRIKFIILLFVAWLVCACSVTKNLPEGEVLYIGQKPLQIQGDDSLNVVGTVALEEVRSALATAPNNAFFGKKFFLDRANYGILLYGLAEKKSTEKSEG